MAKTTKQQTITEKRWVIANATGKGRPWVLPTGLYWTKKQALAAKAEHNFMDGFIVFRVTVNYEVPQ